MPEAEERAQRLTAVLHVLYLIFNEGYTASSGKALQRADLADEAIRLARQVHQLLPQEPEVTGLLALMRLTDARRAARSGPNGELIPLDEQDRSLWNREAISEGVALISSALPSGAVGEYQLQAAVAAVHDEAEKPEDTDWGQILALYTVLKRMTENPMVAVNHAVAAAMVHGPQAGLELLAPLEKDERLQSGHRLETVRAHLLERAGDLIAAEQLYRAAALKTTSVPERNYLIMKAARLRESRLSIE
jgi:predicted RNA polymerase sigma factor